MCIPGMKFFPSVYGREASYIWVEDFFSYVRQTVATCATGGSIQGHMKMMRPTIFHSIQFNRQLWEPIKFNWHRVYMDRFFTNPTPVNHLWNSNTKIVGTIMPNRKEMPKVHFSQKIKKGEKLVTKRQNMMAIKWCDAYNIKQEKLKF